MLSLGLAACDGGRFDDAPATTAHGRSESTPAPATAEAGCNWIAGYDGTVDSAGNFAFPDSNVKYWNAMFTDALPAGTIVHVDGRFPAARYFALHVHDGQVEVQDQISDFEIAPDPGQYSVYVDRAEKHSSVSFGGSYSVRVHLYRDRPADAEPNALYRLPTGPLQSDKTKRTLLSYRLYLPEDSDTGSVALPTLTVEYPDGRIVALPGPSESEACAEIARNQGNANNSPTLVSLLLRPRIPARNPRFLKYDTGVPLVREVGANPHNAFLRTRTSKRLGDYFLVRAKVPATVATQDQAQVRYFSFCQNGMPSTRVVACVADDALHLDSEGFATIVVSDHAVRPAELDRFGDLNWLPWGEETQGFPIIRELLDADSFAQSIRKSSSASLDEDRGDYMPVAIYCEAETIADPSIMDARSLFERCDTLSLLSP